MKYCTHCGKQLTDDAVFCGRCGNRVEPDYETDTAGSGQLKKKTEKKSYITKKSVIIVGIVLAMICAAAGMKAGKLSRQSAQKAKENLTDNRSAQSEYVESSDEISSDQMREMIQDGQQAIFEKDDGADFASSISGGYKYTCTMKDATFHKLYFLKKKKSADYHNIAVLVYKEYFHVLKTDDITDDVADNRDITGYTYVEFHNLKRETGDYTNVDTTDNMTFNDEEIFWYKYKDDGYDLELPGYETEDDLYDSEISYLKKEYGYIED